MSFPTGEITPHNVRNLDPQSLLEPEARTLDPSINGYLKAYFASTVKGLKGNVSVEAATELVGGITDYEREQPLFSVKPFHYMPVPDLPAIDVRCTAESTLVAAINNMRYMQERFGTRPFAAELPEKRVVRAVTWVAPIDDDFHLHVRGASGSGTFSIDLGLGVIDRDNRSHTDNYKELWRAGIDTASVNDHLGARFIRTGSGTKAGDTFKIEAFDRFRKQHHILPQRLLGILGLYFIRELEPDYAVALSTEGAKRYSTLTNSKGVCDYDGIFKNIGFEPTSDRHWLGILNFGEKFYDAIVTAHVKRNEQRVVDSAVEAVINMEPLNPLDADTTGTRLFDLFEDDHPGTLAREIAAAYATRAARRKGYRG